MRRLLFCLLLLIPSFAAADIRVVDGDTIVLDHARIRLFGIDAPEMDQSCSAEGRAWPCGEAAAAYLAELLRGRRVVCETRDVDRYGREVAVCRADGLDVNAQMARRGMAWAYLRFSEDYLDEETAARRDRLGVWRGPNQPAWEYRAAARLARRDAPRDGCVIKGNISSSGRIYHLPGSRGYAKTRINEARGERWFCTEAEARAAGWRPPRR
jgi:endonuclease YncB( thermonuclease family)